MNGHVFGYRVTGESQALTSRVIIQVLLVILMAHDWEPSPDGGVPKRGNPRPIQPTDPKPE